MGGKSKKSATTSASTKQQAPSREAVRLANRIAGAVARLKSESAVKRNRFLETGESRVFLRLNGRPRDIAKLVAYETLGPCSNQEPVWVVGLRTRLRLRRNENDPFRHVRTSLGETEWRSATDALRDYRKIRGFHEKWNAIRFLVDHSYLALPEDGVGLLVLPNEDARQKLPDILRKLGSDGLKKAIKARVVGAASSARRTKIDAVATKVVAFIHHAGILHSIWKDSEYNRLAKLDSHHPDAVAYRFDFFIAAIEGSRFDGTRDVYREYDRLYVVVTRYVSLQRQLDGRDSVPDHKVVDRPKTGTVRRSGRKMTPIFDESNRPLADAVL